MRTTKNATTPAPAPDPLAVWEGAHVEAPPIRYPWIMLDPDGQFLFPSDADADPVISGIAHLLTSTTYGRDRKPYGACASLGCILLARRSRMVAEDGRAWATWDESRAAGAVVRGHSQVAAVILSACDARGAVLWSAPPDAPPVIATLTARGVQGQAVARLLPAVSERLAAQASSDLRRPLPPAAFSVRVGFGAQQTVGDYGYTFRPVGLLDPAARIREWRPYASGASAVPGIRAAYDDAQAWALQWSSEALRSSRERAAVVAEPAPHAAPEGYEGDAW
jgi:hypothetical protein